MDDGRSCEGFGRLWGFVGSGRSCRRLIKVVSNGRYLWGRVLWGEEVIREIKGFG